MAQPGSPRWPPAYDEEELRNNIRSIVESDQLEASFYEPATRKKDGFNQGDVLDLGARFAFLNQEAAPEAEKDGVRFWLVAGNSCDLTRDLEAVRWTLLVPVRDEGALGSLPAPVRAAFRRYEHGRRFLLPGWSSETRDRCLVAEFLEAVTIDRRGLKRAKVVARMEYAGWILFHSCLVRYLARDDGRHD